MRVSLRTPRGGGEAVDEDEFHPTLQEQFWHEVMVGSRWQQWRAPDQHGVHEAAENPREPGGPPAWALVADGDVLVPRVAVGAGGTGSPPCQRRS